MGVLNKHEITLTLVGCTIFRHSHAGASRVKDYQKAHWAEGLSPVALHRAVAVMSIQKESSTAALSSQVPNDPVEGKEDQTTPWVFDNTVAQNFHTEAQHHIPGYARVLTLCVNIAKTFTPSSARIADVGCAIGETLVGLHNAGFTELVGIDNAGAMLHRARSRPELAHVEFIHTQDFPYNKGPFDIVLANWTLHFIAERKTYLHDIWRGLKPGGLLVLTEKMQSTNDNRTLYHAFKARQGLSHEEICIKEKRLEGILEPRPLGWYIDVLNHLGCRDVDIIHAELGFITLLARK